MLIRPWPLVILAAMQVLSPFFNVLYNCVVLGVAPTQFYGFLQQHGTLEIIEFFALIPLSGVAIYLCKAWSYPVVLAVLARTAFSNFEQWQTSSSAYPTTLPLLGVLLQAGAAAYFLLPQVRRTYFNPRMRWWESLPRYEVDIEAHASINGSRQECRVSNLSRGGAFIALPTPLELRDRVELEFVSENTDVRVRGQVAYRAHWPKNGLGIQFENSRASRAALRRVTRSLEARAVARRPDRVDRLQDLRRWCVRLFRTGQGWKPLLASESHDAETKSSRMRTQVARAVLLVCAGLGLFFGQQLKILSLIEPDLYSAGQIAANRGDCVRAGRYFLALLERDPLHPGALSFLGDCQIRSNEFSEAILTFERLAQVAPSGKVFLQLERLKAERSSR